MNKNLFKIVSALMKNAEIIYKERKERRTEFQQLKKRNIWEKNNMAELRKNKEMMQTEKEKED